LTNDQIADEIVNVADQLPPDKLKSAIKALLDEVRE
jgi:hypothetical protein